MRNLSKELFTMSQKLIPGGVNSPVRSFQSVGGDPVFMESGKGSKITDADQNEYIDYCMSWGPLILGHAHPDVLQKIKKTIEKGLTFGACTGFELELAKLITSAMPQVEMVRFVSSGTEAVMSALRLARGFTNRKIILKFDGCYHGHADALLVAAGSGLATLGISGSAGVPQESTQHTLSLTYNDLDEVKKAFEKYPKDIAAVIVEPIAGNMGLVNPRPEFLEGLRTVCTENGALLIFDEVISGFRAAYGGAGELYNIKADLTCLGKIIGGGLPLGAFGGRQEVMKKLAPLGPVYQAGTMSGNPVCVAAGIKTLKLLKDPEIYEKLGYHTEHLVDEMQKMTLKAGVEACIQRNGSLFTLFFAKGPIENFDQAKKANTKRFEQYFHAMLNQGIYLPPAQFECWFMSTAHSSEDIQKTLSAHEKALKLL